MSEYRTMERPMGRTQQRAEVLGAFMRGVYAWMSAGLGLTAALAWLVAGSPTLMLTLWSSPVLVFGLVIAQLGLVFWLSARIGSMAPGTATAMFLAYSALNGVTLSTVFAIYSLTAVAKAFVCTAGMFGALSIYGLVTRRDLTSWGSFLFMGLVGVLLASLVNMFFRSPAVDFALSIMGVLVFTGLTAYDTQMLKEMGRSAPLDDAAAVQRGTILGALRLYLDFINLFLLLLRLLNNRD